VSEGGTKGRREGGREGCGRLGTMGTSWFVYEICNRGSVPRTSNGVYSNACSYSEVQTHSPDTVRTPPSATAIYAILGYKKALLMLPGL
jgi:hypothetical protein